MTGRGGGGPEVVVAVRGLSKRFKLYRQPRHRLLEWATLGRACWHDDFWALRDVSFEVRQGECLGIIGVNGAGKSTLLKILSRALHPTAGSFEVRGRVASLLELGTGFHPDLTGRQNLFQSAQLLGFPRDYVRARLEAILDFADIGEFVDQPVRQYSSGMFVRLAFALFAHLEPDVYIVDEALAVGDVFFQQKCFRRFEDLRRGGCSILFVSHDMEAVTHLCDRAVLLSGGRLVSGGDPVSVVHDYFALSGQAYAAPAPGGPPPRAATAGAAVVPAPVREAIARGVPDGLHVATGTRTTEIVGFAITASDGREAATVPSGGALTFWYLVRARGACDDLNVGIHFYDRRGVLVFAVGTMNRGIALPRLAPGQRLLCGVFVRLPLQPGVYTVVPQTGGLTGGSPDPGVLHDRLEPLPPLVVTRAAGTGPTPFYGLVDLETNVTWTEDL